MCKIIPISTQYSHYIVQWRIISEPLKLTGEGEYNLNALKEIKVTDSYLNFDQNIRKCQNNDPILNCTTKHYTKSLLEKCGCVPSKLKLTENGGNVTRL